MAVQIPHHIHPEVSAEGALRRRAPRAWGGVPPIGGAEGVQDRGGARDGRSRPHAREHSAETGGIERGGLLEGEERDPCGAAFPEEGTQLRRAASVGEGLLRGHGGPGHGKNPALHPRSGGDGSINLNYPIRQREPTETRTTDRLKPAALGGSHSSSLRLCRRFLTPPPWLFLIVSIHISRQALMGSATIHWEVYDLGRFPAALPSPEVSFGFGMTVRAKTIVPAANITTPNPTASGKIPMGPSKPPPRSALRAAARSA